ncbi:HD domain-containing protein [Kushneria aurantia]|uniref:HD domain-containing protein n=1 Tax=Kushneria aurantia TaxID=504092 RepID=A0ABV6G333_9GAMM|nr:HD domain-containing protein [Kushneria aurantia]
MDIEAWEQELRSFTSKHLVQDEAHDVYHTIRVAEAAKIILDEEGGDPFVVITACYFHDCVSLPKNAPNRQESSKLSAEKCISILKERFSDFPRNLQQSIYHAILAHSFSANIAPETLEAKIVQDADRLDALGAIGLARVFYIAGSMGQELWSEFDPFALRREVNDKEFALDHFQSKLLKLPYGMNTNKGHELAKAKCNYLVEFLEKLSEDIGGNSNDYNEVKEKIWAWKKNEQENCRLHI